MALGQSAGRCFSWRWISAFIRHSSTVERSEFPEFPPSSLGSLLCILAGTKFPAAAFWRWAAGRIAGYIVLSRQYFVRQAAALLQFAKETTNPQLAAVLIEKAADLKSQIDEFGAAPDPGPQTPDAQPES
jgi:hypothetical protein